MMDKELQDILRGLQLRLLTQDRVPDCHGMTVRDAMALLRAAGMRVRFTGQGKVVSQSPAARTDVRKGTTVTLELQKSEIRLTH